MLPLPTHTPNPGLIDGWRSADERRGRGSDLAATDPGSRELFNSPGAAGQPAEMRGEGGRKEPGQGERA